eukprot:jgi/Bigna1/85618/estExt_fgenesh1_pg.C_50062
MPQDKPTVQHDQKAMEKFLKMETWDVKEVGEYISSLGFKDISEIFMAHKIDGSLLPSIGKAEMKEMGVKVVGDRLKFLKINNKNKVLARRVWRNKVIWEGEEFREGPCGDMLPFGFPYCCWTGVPDKYKVTNTKFTALMKTYHEDGYFPCLTDKTIQANNFDLTTVNDVDYSEEVGRNVTIHNFIFLFFHGLKASFAMLTAWTTLVLKKGMAKEVSEIIQNAVEENTLREASNPNPAVME